MENSIDQILIHVNETAAISLAMQLGTAFLCGCVIAAVFRLVRSRDHVQPTFPATLVLLTILCAMLPLVIGQNVAWAFGLVGALSIVRFRTVIEDTHDITFVIFAVLVGMAVGADQLTIAIVGIVVTGGAAVLVRPRGNRNRWINNTSRLRVRMGTARDPETVLSEVFGRNFSRVEMTSGGTSKQGTSLNLTYRVQLNTDVSPTDLIRQLNQIDGVQNVELSQLR